MKEVTGCPHQQVTFVFRRSGTHLHPKVWMEERCVACDLELDRKPLTRGAFLYAQDAKS